MPLMIMALALLAVVPASFPRPVLVALVIGLRRLGHVAKIVRAQTLTLKELDYVAAARLSGWGTVADRPPRTAARRSPRPSSPTPRCSSRSNISVEAALSFLGVGVKPPTPSWGQMLTAADVWYQAAPQYLLLPAGALFVTVLALTVLGDGVRTALDPRAASRLRIGTGRKQEAKADTGRTVRQGSCRGALQARPAGKEGAA